MQESDFVYWKIFGLSCQLWAIAHFFFVDQVYRDLATSYLQVLQLGVDLAGVVDLEDLGEEEVQSFELVLDALACDLVVLAVPGAVLVVLEVAPGAVLVVPKVALAVLNARQAVWPVVGEAAMAVREAAPAVPVVVLAVVFAVLQVLQTVLDLLIAHDLHLALDLRVGENFHSHHIWILRSLTLTFFCFSQ